MKSFALWAVMTCLMLSGFLGRVRAMVVEGPVTNSFTGHIFYIIAPESWPQAQAEAHSLGGHLTTIRDSFENEWIVTNLLVDFSGAGGPNLSALPLWIGLYDPTTNDGSLHAADFIWDSGETNAYRNWNPGEPSNTGNAEYYACINWHFAQSSSATRGTWNDAPVAGSSGYGGTTDGPYYGIVELGTGLPPLSAVPGAVYGPVVSSINGHEYFIVPATNWTTAEAEAQALGGNLTTVRSQAEDLWIVTNLLVDLTDYGGPNLSTLPLWIGLYDPTQNDGSGSGSQHAADFIWISGETATYRNWYAGTDEPNNNGNLEYYAAINWEYAAGITSDHSVWDDTPLDGTTAYGSTSTGPYYGIAEVNTNAPGTLQIGVANGAITISPRPNVMGAVLQSTASLNPPILWTPVWTNTSGGSYTIHIGTGSQFFRLQQ